MLPAFRASGGVGLILKGGVGRNERLPPCHSRFQRAPAIASFLTELVSTLSGAPFTTEIQIVDDGSPPAEQQALLLAVATGRFNNAPCPAPPAFLRITERAKPS